MQYKWWERLWQAMQCVQKRKNCRTARAVERAAKRKCKKDEHQSEVLLAKASDWSTHVFDPMSVKSVTLKTTLVQECLKEEHTLAKRKGETLPWLECMPSGIRKSNAWRRSSSRGCSAQCARWGDSLVER